MIIDFHTHIFPSKIASRAVAALESTSGEKAFLDGTLDSLKKSMEYAGIDYAVTLPIVTRTSQTESIFQYAAAVAEEPGIISFGSVHPHSPDVKGDVRRIRQAGLKGIKLHPDYQDAFIDDIEMVRTMYYAAEQGLIIVIHAGEDISFPDVQRSTPKRLFSVLGELKGAVIVCAHTGGWKRWNDVEELLMGTDLYIDTSFTAGWCSDEQFKRILTGWNPEHILFGTDSPWDGQKKAQEDLQKLELPLKLYDQIFFKNAAKLLKIPY